MNENLVPASTAIAEEVVQAAHSQPAAVAARKLPPGFPTEAVPVHLLGVDYSHLRTKDGGDLYLTQFGRPFWRYLQPDNWYEHDWFTANRQRLEGTSTVYRVPTRPVSGRSIDLVVKFSRVGEDIPMDTLTINKFVNAEFNSPFEEFSLLMELRQGWMGPQSVQIKTQYPLAIYVPSQRLYLWETGRSEYKIAAKIRQHAGVEIDILRQYIVVYGWVKGLNAVETADHLGIGGERRSRFIAQANSLAIHELAQKGFLVVDMKPQHVILRPQPDGSLLRDANGQLVYALIDYELLQRAPEYEQAVRCATRRFYLKHMARRFDTPADKPFPSHLKAVNILGVDYVFGHAESTGGLLWVVGKDPDLFNYFLAERWRRTAKTRLSEHNQVYHTKTKDDINLVWRVSRMGNSPWACGSTFRKQAIHAHGFNSPFEEFAIAMELSRQGRRVVYPRAIYMTGSLRDSNWPWKDDRRFLHLSEMLTPEGTPLLRRDRDYITVWGFWNGPDDMLAEDDTHRYRAFDAATAHQQGLIDGVTLDELLALKVAHLRACGFEDLRPKPDHLLVSVDHHDALVRDADGKPDIRLCNFELVRKIETPAEPSRDGA